MAGGATDSHPPSTIRVYRVALGRIDTVDFKSYVQHVLPSEWVASWPAEALRAGAMAAKTYGWYWCLHSKYPGRGYDVKDNTADQVYNPNVAYASTNAAVDATWAYRMTKSGTIFGAMYCDGAYNDSQTTGQCSARYGWTPGSYMSQNGSHYWADHGRDWQAILRFYYSNLEIDTWTKGEQIMFLLQLQGNPTIYISNGIERRYIVNWERGALPLIDLMKRNGLDTTIVQVANAAELDDVGGPLHASTSPTAPAP